MAKRRDPHWFKFGVNDSTTASANGTSKRIVVRHLENILIQIDGTFVADVTVKTRLHPDLSMLDLATISAPGFVTITNNGRPHDVEITISNYASGEIKVMLVGQTAQE